MKNLLVILLILSVTIVKSQTISFTQRHQVEYVLPEQKGDNFEILNSDNTPTEFVIDWEAQTITIKRTYSSQDYIEYIVDKYVNEDQDIIQLKTNYGSMFKLYYMRGSIHMILYVDSIGNKLLYDN